MQKFEHLILLMKTPFYSIENTIQFPKAHTPEVRPDIVSAVHLLPSSVQTPAQLD